MIICDEMAVILESLGKLVRSLVGPIRPSDGW